MKILKTNEFSDYLISINNASNIYVNQLTFIYYDIILNHHIAFHNSFFTQNTVSIENGEKCDSCIRFFLNKLNLSYSHSNKTNLNRIGKFNYFAMKQLKGNIICIANKNKFYTYKKKIHNMTNDEIKYLEDLIIKKNNNN